MQPNPHFTNVRRLALLLGLLLTLTSFTRAQAPATAPAKTQRLFWKVTSPTTEVYFLGSIHMATKDIYPLPVEIDAAFNKSNTLVVEIDLSKVNQLELAMKMMQIGMYGEGDSLDKHVSPETMKSFRAFCLENGLPAEMLSTMKPPMAAMTVEALAVQKQGMTPEDGIDMHFMNLAKEKKVVELETADAQMNLLMGIDDKLAEKWLVETMKDNSKDELQKITKAWKEGDDKTLATSMADDDKKDPETAKMSDLVIYKRNDEMTKKIDDMLKGKDKVFVVVGAAHLVGEKGILKQLEAKKYKVERPELTAPPATATVPAAKP